MRYSASEKYEIIRLVEQSSLSAKQTLARLDIHRSTFYAWLKRYDAGGIDALEDRKPAPRSPWNKLPGDEQVAIVDLALEKSALSPREVAVTYTDEKERFVSESTVYRLLKAQDLITSPAYILMEAGDRFQHPTTRVNEMWQITSMTREWTTRGAGRTTHRPRAKSNVGIDHSRIRYCWRITTCRATWSNVLASLWITIITNATTNHSIT